eukprot:CAMPEP_0178425530 /NCGR_PEP_ID=MMETSP0689_2-20121128/28770_1 /TAXON_ID=160604 /ORGANISM="Amphidinium massartii, Strain CS-259" /LENGTH=167 /DNA_ID=CAMNT_0020047195 /DNA_START=339 /DNA_END=838 /DNA_ORIENTATION=+
MASPHKHPSNNTAASHHDDVLSASPLLAPAVANLVQGSASASDSVASGWLRIDVCRGPPALTHSEAAASQSCLCTTCGKATSTKEWAAASCFLSGVAVGVEVVPNLDVEPIPDPLPGVVQGMCKESYQAAAAGEAAGEPAAEGKAQNHNRPPPSARLTKGGGGSSAT